MELERGLTFDDVLMVPKFSDIKSRKDVNPGVILGKRIKLRVPVVSSNMETITGVAMARAVSQFQGLAILHRFWSISENVRAFYQATTDNGYKDNVGVSIGLGEEEQERAKELANAGAWIFSIDVAHGAQQQVVDQYLWLREQNPGAFIMVGNFAAVDTITEFIARCKKAPPPNCFKVGIGPGSVCTTRIKTGMGLPQLSCVEECASLGVDIISDGGHRFPQDICKALATGAKAVMLGGMLAGTDEAAGTSFTTIRGRRIGNPTCIYKGSAYKEKVEEYNTSEGEKVTVEYKGPVLDILKDIEGGLRSSMSYANALTIAEYLENTEFRQVTSATVNENIAHAKIRWK